MTNLSIGFRAAGTDDRAFLFDLYESTREGEFAFLDEGPRRQLLHLQFTAQQAGYTSQFQDSEHLIILNGAEPVGRVWIARTDRDIRIVDISLLPQYRRLGIGTVAYRRVQTEAAAAHKVVTASVLKTNASSLEFHRAFGFTVTGENEVSYALERAPDA